MKITRRALAKYASGFLSLLDAAEINTLDDIERKTGRKFFNSSFSRDYLSFNQRLKKLYYPEVYYSSYTVNYHHTKSGIPLSISLSPVIGYSDVAVILADELLLNHVPIALDKHGNFLQQMRISTDDFKVAREWLDKLRTNNPVKITEFLNKTHASFP